jgi:trans-aconitate 2-methyltransferase
MLAKARSRVGRARYEWGDIAAWRPREKVDVLFSNAVYQWVPDHRALFTRLIDFIAGGGVFAAQMPRNFAAPSHSIMRELAESSPFAGRVDLRSEPVLSPELYYDILSPLSGDLQIWETEYLHVLEGDDPVFEWTRGTALLPVYAGLEGEELDTFLAEYKARLRSAYPKRSDGKTLFPFRRIFLVGTV